MPGASLTGGIDKKWGATTPRRGKRPPARFPVGGRFRYQGLQVTGENRVDLLDVAGAVGPCQFPLLSPLSLDGTSAGGFLRVIRANALEHAGLTFLALVGPLLCCAPGVTRLALLSHAIDDVDVTHRCARDDVCEANGISKNDRPVVEMRLDNEWWS